ncbi:PAAR domain-containing protein [Stappia sp. TSB10GB4]|uniref:PAAR domain-containing protein n=1 Tax=Stappia sp. TSB10GB4 TaxID=2003584 RepID=UPI0016469781|nr:PAAR domain-containing protein [Stappia sp. TSB10GB4]
MAVPSKARAMRPHAVTGAALSGRSVRISLALLLPLSSMPAAAQDLPACAVTGAASVMINGRPALRLSDVAACPPGLFETVPGVFVEGEPAVRSATPAQGCVAAGSANVTIDGTGAARAGDVACPAK